MMKELEHINGSQLYIADNDGNPEKYIWFNDMPHAVTPVIQFLLDELTNKNVHIEVAERQYREMVDTWVDIEGDWYTDEIYQRHCMKRNGLSLPANIPASLDY
jgi:hypothetical protein